MNIKQLIPVALVTAAVCCGVAIATAEDIQPKLLENATAWGLSLRTDADVYAAGEAVRATISANTDFYVRLVHVDADGVERVLEDPNGAEVFAGEVNHAMPAEGALLQVGPPDGEEKLIAYIGAKAFPYFTATSDEPILCPIGQRVAGDEQVAQYDGPTVSDWADIAVTVAVFRTVE